MAKKVLNIKDSRQRPSEIEIDLKEIEAMARLNLTQEEIAEIKGIWPETLTRWKSKYEEINQAIIAGKIKGKAALLGEVRKIAFDGKRDKTTLNALKYLLSVLHDVNEKKQIETTDKTPLHQKLAQKLIESEESKVDGLLGE
jgi:transcriptional regulator with XRE-family HTH domain